MGTRNSGYERKERDLYETPEWVTKALIPHIPQSVFRVWEPACGSGKMVRVLAEYFDQVTGTDIHETCHDYLQTKPLRVDAIITNPPFHLADKFIEKALSEAPFVAMLLRSDFDSAKSRQHLFRNNERFRKKVVLLKRIAWFVDETTGKPKASPSTNHAWYIWWNASFTGSYPYIEYAP